MPDAPARDPTLLPPPPTTRHAAALPALVLAAITAAARAARPACCRTRATALRTTGVTRASAVAVAAAASSVHVPSFPSPSASGTLATLAAASSPGVTAARPRAHASS